MKKLKIKALNRYNALLSALISLLGFSSACTMYADEYGAPMPEYGAPVATFTVKGTITSADTNQPIEGINVKMDYDSVYSSPAGQYQTSVQRSPESQTFEVKFRDVDGAANGVFEPLDTTIEFKNPQFNGGSGTWNQGTVEKEIDIHLKPTK